ncbi:type IX secretion system membrane protein PorP/SprF [Winogradskyella maritima]|uniref:Type IX secretion system membrane protein PorP/SprF n=1 Tax=Winogradskyella maritima TaxID=1517766 RepID=A0ABV8AIB2_9FLAO|nr:type IX secretion system membrane protein PorP/SprF [Winogradskyella maritima]
MKFYKNTLKIIALLVFGGLYAQQEPNYALYRYTMNAINPAYAGADGFANLTTNFRSQWSGVQSAPETQTLFYSQPLGNNLGIGLSFVNDQVFVEQNTSFNIDFSYKLQMNEETNLFFGIKAGGSSYSIDRDKFGNFQTADDPALGNIDTGFRPNFGAGLYLMNEKYFLSVSVPHILLSERISNDNGTVSVANEKAHFYFSGGYNFDISEDVEFRPSAMARLVSGAPISADFTAAFRFIDRIEVGAMYRTDSAWAGVAMLSLADWFDLGYAYEASSQDVVSNGSDGTHEVVLRFNFRGDN